MIRWAVAEDAPAIEGFLSDYPETSMFLRGNLAAHGIGSSQHRNASDYLIWPAEGPIRAIFGCSNGGYLMVQAPGAPVEAYAEAATALAGRRVCGLTGDVAQTAHLLTQLGLSERLSHNAIEPLYRLALERLPQSMDTVRPPQPEDEAMLIDWFARYARDTDMEQANPEAAREEAEARATRMIEATRALLLLEEGAPVAMAAINAEVADIVQVGGVFVPEVLRNRGYARRVTSALLQTCAAEGARIAILFANNPAAARAYEAIGFRHVGEYRVALTNAPMVLGEVPA